MEVALPAIIAAVISGVAGLLTGVATLKGKSVDANTALFTNMSSHMETLREENADFRIRVRTLEEDQVKLRDYVSEARLETQRCEADKRLLETRVRELEMEVRGG